MNSAIPTIILGSAMWGWTVPKSTVFELLDEWYAVGFREVDAATNYPIDKDPEHFRLSEKILLEWLNTHGVNDLQVMMKVGSVNNLRSPDHVLTRSFVLMMLDEYLYLLGKNLGTFMVHWDNREEESAIRDTLEGLEEARRRGLQVGLSGILHPEIYAGLNQEFQFDFRIQLKHNVLQSDYAKYAPFHGQRRFIAYGINAGGLKLDGNYSSGSTLVARGANLAAMEEAAGRLRNLRDAANLVSGRQPLREAFQFGMIYSFYHPDFQGILVGASSKMQLKEAVDFYRTLIETDYGDVFQTLAKS